MNYVARVPELNTLAQKQFDATRTYGDVVHIVHLYVIEPHPGSPDPTPYRGRDNGMVQGPAQPRTYDDRVALARDTDAWLKGSHLMLVDDLTPRGRNNPLWCTYGPTPNCGFLIGQDGTILVSQFWVEPNDIEAAIDSLLRH